MPSDIDAYVLTALAYTRVKQYEQAIERLTAAKGVTDDKAVLEKLDDYITRIEQEQRSVDEK
jgi:23S rRNA A2030 N6-methylase RlmJ